LDNAIDVSVIAADAIGASEIATSAIGTDEFAAEADNIGINWGDVSNPTTTVGLSGTTIKASTDTETDIAALNDFDPASDSVIVDGSSFASLDNAIDASVIADDAIDYATFAASAPSVWWNEGKTGYSLAATGSDADTGIIAMKTKLTAIDSKTTNLPTDPADDSDLDAAIAALNNISTAEVDAEVDEAIENYKLDHLVLTADSDDPADNSILAKMAASDGDWSGFSAATDALEAIRDQGDAAWVTAGNDPTAAAIADAVWDEVKTEHVTDNTMGS
jgi:hypothetical protein